MTTVNFPNRLIYGGVDLGVVESAAHAWVVSVQHEDACIDEGICPVHRTRLAVIPHVGYCESCSKVWFKEDQRIGYVATDAIGEFL